jgi:peptidyl-prolyl cis-trans isomerase C
MSKSIGGSLLSLLVPALIGLAGFYPAYGQTPSPVASGDPGVQTPIAHPEALMALVAREYDKEPDQAVLVLGTMAITRGEMAEVIRTLPPSLVNLGFAAVSLRAIDILVAQKTFAFAALKDGIDKDPAFLRRQNAIREKALADIWLGRKANTAVTEQALRDRYTSDIVNQPAPVEVRARVIAVEDEAVARTIVQKAQNGSDFADLAKQFSKDATAAKGGDLGYVTQQAVAPEIAQLIFALSPGQVSAFPLRTPSGYLIVKVEGRQQRAAPSFEEARPTLEAALRADATRNAINDVLSHVKLENMPELPHR